MSRLWQRYLRDRQKFIQFESDLYRSYGLDDYTSIFLARVERNLGFAALVAVLLVLAGGLSLAGMETAVRWIAAILMLTGAFWVLTVVVSLVRRGKGDRVLIVLLEGFVAPITRWPHYVRTGSVTLKSDENTD